MRDGMVWYGMDAPMPQHGMTGLTGWLAGWLINKTTRQTKHCSSAESKTHACIPAHPFHAYIHTYIHTYLLQCCLSRPRPFSPDRCPSRVLKLCCSQLTHNYTRIRQGKKKRERKREYLGHSTKGCIPTLEMASCRCNQEANVP